MPKLLSCPVCGYTKSWAIRRYHRKCKNCRSEWSPNTYHPVSGFRLSRREWYQIIKTFLRDGTITTVQDECNIAYATAQKSVAFIRLVMSQDAPELFMGTCEADETYVGGAWKNKAVHIRKQGTKRGRGTQKQAIFGLIQRNPSQIRIQLVPNTKGKTLRPIIRSKVCRGSIIYTDGHKGYRALKREGYFHDWVDHDAGEYVRGKVHTQTIDGYWGLLKTHLDSIGGIRKEHLHLFIGEHQWRYNHRHLTRKEKVKKLYQIFKRFGGRN